MHLVGRGRLGSALAARLGEAGIEVVLFGGREVAAGAETAVGVGAWAVLLAVPDAATAEVAARIPPGPPVGHCSGAAQLDVLAGHPLAFSLHPLQTVVGPSTSFAGAYAAINATTPEAGGIAEALAGVLGLTPITISGADRAAYHAAASIASNFLVTLEGFAERLAQTCGLPRAALAPLARASLENWVRLGAAGALTGPVARGDEQTVRRQRAAIAERLPGDLALFDALTEATRALARPGSLEQEERTRHGEEQSTR